MSVHRQSGFTLVEILAAGLISTLLAGILIAVLSFTNKNISEGTAQYTVSQIHTVVMDQLKQNAFNACRVKQAGEDATLNFDLTNTFDVGATNEILFCRCSPSTSQLAGYRINAVNMYLEEWLALPPGGGIPGYYPFLVGTDTAFLDPSLSSFSLNDERRSFIATLAFQSRDGSYTFPVIAETIRCRNPHL